MLKQSEQQHAFHNDDRHQINRARKEAEALFQPKPKVVEPPRLNDPSPTDATGRKPRILSASAPSLGRTTVEAQTNPEPQIVVSASQVAHANRELLNRARVAIFQQQRELQKKLDAIATELHAMDAYEAARRGKTFGRRDRRRV